MKTLTEKNFWMGILTGGLIAIGTWQGIVQWDGKSEKAHVLARVGGESITKADFLQAAKDRSGIGGAVPEKQALMDEIVLRRAMVERAKAASWSESPEFQKELEDLYIRNLREASLEAKLAESAAPSEEETREFYKKTLDEYRTPERRELAVLFKSSDSDKINETRNQMKDIRQSILSAKASGNEDEMWAESVARSSHDRTSRYNQGRIGSFEKGQSYLTDQAVIDAGFALDEEGSISEVVSGEGGLYLVRLMNLEPGGTKPFTDVAKVVRHRLMLARQAAAQAEFEKETLEGTRITINREELESVELGGSYVNAVKSRVPQL